MERGTKRELDIDNRRFISNEAVSHHIFTSDDDIQLHLRIKPILGPPRFYTFCSPKILPVGGIVSYEAVGHHDEGQEAARDVLHRHHRGQPDPAAPGVQKDGIEKVEDGPENLAGHTDGQERLSKIKKEEYSLYHFPVVTIIDII